MELLQTIVHKQYFFVNKPKKIRNDKASDFKQYCNILLFKIAHFTVFIHPLGH